MKHIYFLGLILLFICSCNSNAENNTIELQNEINSLKGELENEKHGAVKLLDEAKVFYSNNDFITAKSKINELLSIHPTDTVSIEAKKLLTNIDENIIWQKADNTREMNNVDKYISLYPKGKFIKNAKIMKNELEIVKKETAYEDAVESNSSYKWKRFLEDYPNHPKKEEIEKKIIELEVDEILSDRNTGQMPSFDRDSYSTSSTSNVSIKNNTGCELTVRYSGAKVIKIEIPNGSSHSVVLPSGNYRVAASACSSNYGASEYLSGDYSSTFYIQRSYR